MSISDYVIKFEQLNFKFKSFHMEIVDDVLTYRKLNTANLTNEYKQLVKAPVSKMDYQTMNDKLKSSLPVLQLMLIAKLIEMKLMLNQGKMRYFIKQKIRITDNIIVLEDPSVEIMKILKIKLTKRKVNPLNNKEETSRYNFCWFKFHWEKNCPDAAEKYDHDL